jgi:hypothetical protein
MSTPPISSDGALTEWVKWLGFVLGCIGADHGAPSGSFESALCPSIHKAQRRAVHIKSNEGASPSTVRQAGAAQRGLLSQCRFLPFRGARPAGRPAAGIFVLAAAPSFFVSFSGKCGGSGALSSHV